LSAGSKVPLVILIIGGLNWLMVGLFRLNLIAMVLGNESAASRIAYVIIFPRAYGLTRLRPDLLSEDFTRRALAGKTAATLLIVAGLMLVGLKGGRVSGRNRIELRGAEWAAGRA